MTADSLGNANDDNNKGEGVWKSDCSWALDLMKVYMFELCTVYLLGVIVGLRVEENCKSCNEGESDGVIVLKVRLNELE